MCGIVGFIGQGPAKPVLLEGLKRLEYRGYDSAGLALYAARDQIHVCRNLGRVAGLEEAAKNIGQQESQGIAHTRWATHGVPSEVNAHPHRAGRVILVHNGIIENYAELKNELMQKGVRFESQTDTEVMARLIDSCREQNANGKRFNDLAVDEKRAAVLDSLYAAMGRVRGHYAIVFMVEGLPGYMFGAQCGAPLVAGQPTHKEAHGTLVASDLQALLPYTQKVSFLSVGTVFEGSAQGFRYFSAGNKQPVQLKTESIEWSADRVAKEGYEHFMLKEIFEQPRVVADTLSGRLPQSSFESFVWDHPQAHEVLWKNVDRLYLVACGTAFYAAMTAKYYFERWAKIPVEIDIASEFRYRDPVLGHGTVVGVISQSGETADTLAALRLAKEKGVSTFSVCNVPGSSIAREAGFHYPTKAGPEIGVASTKAFTAQLTVLIALAMDVARLRGHFRGEDGLQALARLPHDMEQVLAKAKDYRELGASLKDKKTILFVGRGPMYPLALEGALKTKELAYRHAEGYAAGELKHGPIALVDQSLAAVVLAPPDALYEKTVSNLEEIKARKGFVIGVGSEKNAALASHCDHFIAMPELPEFLTPILYSLPLQLMAYGLAHALGCDIDKPRNLAKSVTVE